MLKWKVLEIWHEPDNLSWETGKPSLLQTEDMLNLSPSSRLGQFIEFITAHDYSALVVWGDPEYAPEAYASLNKYLSDRGIGMILRRLWNEVLRGLDWRPDPSDGIYHFLAPIPKGIDWPPPITPGIAPDTLTSLCPYAPETRDYWEFRTARDAAMLPGLTGYCFQGLETQYPPTHGGPWHCGCSTCATKSRQQRMIDGLNLLGDILSQHNMTLFWEILQDDVIGQRLEVELFSDLNGKVRSNVMIIIKEIYFDCHIGWPEHPLYDRIEKGADGHSPYITSVQLVSEYHGMGRVIFSEVERWSKLFRRMQETDQQGIWLNALVLDQEPWDHPLNKVNWFAADRYAENPEADPKAIMNDWAVETFGAEAAPVVIEVIRLNTEANMKIFYFDGGWNAYHSRMSDLMYLDSRLCGPYRYTDRVEGKMGMDLPVDMYLPEHAAEIKKDTSLRLAFDKVSITEELRAEMIEAKQEAVDLLNESVRLWRSLDDLIKGDIYKYVLESLEGRRNDAIFWRVQMEMYMDYKLDQLTESRMEELLEECRGLKGVWVEDPMATGKLSPPPWTDAATPATFANQLREELRNPQLEKIWGAMIKDDYLGYGDVVPHEITER